MAKVRRVIVTYDDDVGLQVKSEEATPATAAMLLHAALEAVRVELLAARLGAPSQSGIVLAGRPRELS